MQAHLRAVVTGRTLQDAAIVTEAHLVELLDLWPRLPVVVRGQAVMLVEALWAEGFPCGG